MASLGTVITMKWDEFTERASIEKSDYLINKKIEAHTWEVGVRLNTIDHMFIGLQEFDQMSRVTIPDEDMSTIRATHHIFVTPKVSFFDLEFIVIHHYSFYKEVQNQTTNKHH